MAQRPLGVRDLTARAAHVTAEELEAMPVETFNEVLEQQAGVVDGHIRGGRHGETLYMIDGIPVTDPYDGSMAVDVENESIQELQLITGAFNAEYGQAMSGVVNIVTKDGSDDFKFNASGYLGDHVSSHKDIFRNIDAFSPSAQYNFQGSFSGPVIPGKLYAFATIRNFVASGHLYGVRQYNIDDTFYSEVDPRNDVGGEGEWWLKGLYRGDADSIEAGSEGYTVMNLDSIEAFKAAGYRLGTGDSALVPMNPYEKTSYHVKLTYRVTPRIALKLNVLRDNSYQQGWAEGLQFNPDGNLNRTKEGGSITLNLNHQLTQSTFYQLGYSRVDYEWKEYRYEDPWAFYDSTDTDGDGFPDQLNPDKQDIQLVSVLSTQQLYSFLTGGIYNNWFNRRTNSQVYKFDLTSQLSKVVEFKAGAQARMDDVYRRFFAYDPQTGFPIWFDLDVNPREISAFAQTKLEFKNLILNAGLRWDHFESDGQLPVDERDPDIYSPIKPNHQWKDSDGDGHVEDAEPFVDADSNGIWGSGESWTDIDGDGHYDATEKADSNRYTLQERRAFWYRNASAKDQFSPRIGIGYPISDRGVIHVSYGHFFQIPNLEDLFNNPEYRLVSGTGVVNTLFGNPDLDPQQTISYEIGLQQEITDDFGFKIDFYFRDIRNLVSADKIVVTSDQRKYAQYVNRDYANTRGLTFSLDKRHTNYWSMVIDYTFQLAQGNASDPNAAFYARQGNSEPEVRLLRLDWDQRHSLNLNVTVGDLAVWGTSLTGQFGSGLPYTPSDDQGNLGVSIPNSGTKPLTAVFDWKIYRNFKISGLKINAYLKAENLLDRLNQYGVYGDTGTAEYTLAQLRAEQNNAVEAINTLDQFFLHPTMYGEPRRVTLGFSIGMDK